MRAKQKFPTERELKQMRGLLSSGPAAKPLSKNADPVEKIKHTLCAEFVKYKNKNIARKTTTSEPTKTIVFP